jgi:hypothetical protein
MQKKGGGGGGVGGGGRKQAKTNPRARAQTATSIASGGTVHAEPAAPWLQNANREQSVSRLRGRPDGTFLVRFRDANSHAFSVNIKGKVVHKLIAKDEQGGYTVDSVQGDWGRTLEAVVSVISSQLSYKHGFTMTPAPNPDVPDSGGGIARGKRKQSEYLGFDERPTGAGGGIARGGTGVSQYLGFNGTEQDEC